MAFLSQESTSSFIPAKEVEARIAASHLSYVLPSLHVEEVYIQVLQMVSEIL